MSRCYKAAGGKSGTESHLCPLVETWHFELPGRSPIQNYLNLAGLLYNQRLLIENKATASLPSIKINPNEPINHLDRKHPFPSQPRKSCLFLRLDEYHKVITTLSREWPSLLYGIHFSSMVYTTNHTVCVLLNSFDGYHKGQEAKEHLQLSPNDWWSGSV